MYMYNNTYFKRVNENKENRKNSFYVYVLFISIYLFYLFDLFILVVRITETNIKKSVLVRAYGKGSERIIDRRQEIIVSLVFFFFYNQYIYIYNIKV